MGGFRAIGFQSPFGKPMLNSKYRIDKLYLCILSVSAITNLAINIYNFTISAVKVKASSRFSESKRFTVFSNLLL
jgi:hypothetical protein